MQFQTIEGASQRHVVRSTGSGPDVVMLHGFPDTPVSLEQLQVRLATAGFRVSVPWLRGYHPQTITRGRGYDPQTIGQDVLELMDAMEIEQAVIVGHDWGALMAYAAAALRPQRTRAIVTFAIPHPSLLRRTPSAIWRGRHLLGLRLPWASATCRRGDFAYLNRLYGRWAPNWSGSLRERCIAEAKQALRSPQTLRAALSYYRSLPLKTPRLLAQPPSVPGLIVGGTADLMEPALFEQTAAAMPAPSRCVIVQDAGHWPHCENHGVVLAGMLDFLEALARS